MNLRIAERKASRPLCSLSISTSFLRREEILFFKWSPGEPSLVDAGDDAPENYLLLWKMDEDTWLYNDSRDDPIKEYAWIYQGTIGFVCQMW